MINILEILKNSFLDVNFDINLVMHSFILFTFLSLFFALYITKISKNAFNNDLSNMIHNGLSDKIKKIKQNISIKNVINELPLDTLIKNYSIEDKAVTMHNNGLLNTLLSVNILLWVGLIIVILILKYNCGANLNISHLVLENVIIFTCVGIVEYLFFTKIATNFVPVKPSFISQQFLESIKLQLK